MTKGSDAPTRPSSRKLQLAVGSVAAVGALAVAAVAGAIIPSSGGVIRGAITTETATSEWSTAPPSPHARRGRRRSNGTRSVPRVRREPPGRQDRQGLKVPRERPDRQDLKAHRAPSGPRVPAALPALGRW